MGASLVALCAMPAAAQVAGTYSGTSLDGNGVNFTVATDPNTGVLAVTGAGIGFSTICQEGATLNSGWGYGLTQDIVRGRVTNTSYGPYFTIKFSLQFAADGKSATGTVSTLTSTLATVGPKPKEALFCTSAPQSLSVTLQPPPARYTPPASGAVMLSNPKSAVH